MLFYAFPVLVHLHRWAGWAIGHRTHEAHRAPRFANFSFLSLSSSSIASISILKISTRSNLRIHVPIIPLASSLRQLV
jgi:hypothetical protein